MSRVGIVDPAGAGGAARKLLDTVQAQLGGGA